MSDVADALIRVYEETPVELRPAVSPVLAQIMKDQMAIDRVHAETIQQMQAAHEIEVSALKSEITGLSDWLCNVEIEIALRGLCQRGNLDPVPIIDQLASRCRYDGGELIILDGFGCPTTFDDAVRSLD